ncbi:MAG: class I SAM-dependent RNA methyltransferase [Bacteroidetes bacterium]|nr:class I SAM-dependent RNA methyltransferase [Bacteroidota bacterium]MBS1540675.1 class I SAM-dependent RNA methyltransferase [Bacteroidota bacterium]
MGLFNESRRIVVTCNKRLAPSLEKEIIELGYGQAIEHTFSTGVELLGTLPDCIRLNLNLHCASQVLFSLMEFKCNNADQLYDRVLKYSWERIIREDGYFAVTNHTENFSINNELYVNVKIKDAIVDRFRRETGRRPDSGSELNRTVVHLHWRENEAEIFLDTSGETLAKHGYRKIPGRAPMLEALASATILATRWDKKTTFVNPMCGSGTLAIEAALIATNRRPGLFRKNYSFMHVIGYEETVYLSELKKLKDQIHDLSDLKIIATDIKKDAIDISKVNAAAAGVDKLIEFKVCDFELTPLPPPPGIIFFNPEYGERMGDTAELEQTYSRLGDFLKKKCQNYTGYIFTGNLELAKKIGLKASRRIEFYSAKLDCRLLEYELYSGSRRKNDLSAQP